MNNAHSFEAVIGLEVHVRLGIKTKLFCADENSYGKEPNTLISEVSLGYPGSLPVLNREAILFAVKMGLACHSEIASKVEFDRKNYFYPDLPKGYQITQDRNPICKGGFVKVRVRGNNEFFKIELTKIHLEEDAGKSIHRDNGKSAIDFNRAGTALIEIVTEPVIKTSDQARDFLFEIRRMVRYLGISDGNMEEGSLRCDANISIRPAGSLILGKKVEIKNMNSMSNVKKAIDHEIERQIEVKSSDNTIVQETRSFDPSTGMTTPMREKETLTDYRYFPEPDLVPEIIDNNWLISIKENLPEMGWQKEQRFIESYGLRENEAKLLAREKNIAEYYDTVVELSGLPKAASNWIMGPVMKHLNASGLEIDSFPISPDKIASIISYVDKGLLNFGYASKNILPQMIKDPERELTDFIKEKGSEQNLEIKRIIEEVLSVSKSEVKLYKNGKKKLFGALMGSVMRKAGREADPKIIKELLQNTLDNY